MVWSASRPITTTAASHHWVMLRAASAQSPFCRAVKRWPVSHEHETTASQITLGLICEFQSLPLVLLGRHQQGASRPGIVGHLANSAVISANLPTMSGLGEKIFAVHGPLQSPHSIMQ